MASLYKWELVATHAHLSLILLSLYYSKEVASNMKMATSVLLFLLLVVTPVAYGVVHTITDWCTQGYHQVWADGEKFLVNDIVSNDLYIHPSNFMPHLILAKKVFIFCDQNNPRQSKELCT